MLGNITSVNTKVNTDDLTKLFDLLLPREN